MAAEYFSDQEVFTSNHPLPSPADTPYQSLSRRTSKYGTPITDTAPIPFPPSPYDDPGEATADEDISPLDPRRFTPTLHASLVSEILSLRRELDSKHKFIEDLEGTLQTTRNDNDSLAGQLSTSTREGRAMKRQLQQLEHGTLSALEEIAGERDKVKETNIDLRQKLDAAQKKLKTQEDDSSRVHDMLANEKEKWDNEKRALERRVHISETRLKILVEELAAQEDAREEPGLDSDGEEVGRDSGFGHESDTGSVRSSPQRRTSTRIARHSRNLSNDSYRSMRRSYRMSLMSGAGSEGHGRMNGLSLADELIFDEEDEELGELEIDSDDFPENEMRARRALESRQSMRQDEKAKRILGLTMEYRDLATAAAGPTDSEAPKINGTLSKHASIAAPRDITFVYPPPAPQSSYTDTGVQPSPPQSPIEEMAPVAKPGLEEKLDDVVEAEATEKLVIEMSGVTLQIPEPTPLARSETPSEVTTSGKSNESGLVAAEIEINGANQSRKRVSASQSSSSLRHIYTQSSPQQCLMKSSSSQTVEQPLSPPATPTIGVPAPETPISPVFRPEVTSVSTQTELIEEPAPQVPPPSPTRVLPPSPTRAPPPVPILIPSIAIHAPTSAPSSPKEPILPPGTKSAATQTTPDMTSAVVSTGMQTEPIRVDQRLMKLPSHLQPSAISSKPGTPEPAPGKRTEDKFRKDSHEPMVISPRQDLRPALEKAAEMKSIENRYPGNNDNGPLSREQNSILSRPFRTSSLFAGFDGPSSDEEDNEQDLSEDEIRVAPYSTPMLSSRNVKNGRVFNNPPTPVPEDKEVDSVSVSRPSEDSMDRASRVGKRTSITRTASIRRSAMIQNGTAAHIRSRSPSLGSIGSSSFAPKPPFPVPTRSSSRNKPISKSEGSQSPTPRSSGTYAGRRPYGTARVHQRKDSLRKVRSAAVINKGRPRSRSPPLPMPATPVMPASPQLPPMPTDIVAGRQFGHRPQLSTNTSHTGHGSVGSIAHQTSVVDAIAATMVGEWMWKYVRKRKAFGNEASPATTGQEEAAAMTASNGARHKRWVWISPYERSVLWSSKQPTSGTALMGKSGRKLIIQSVLDVADNTPMPKGTGSQPLFNRSILILTPARALKFTAVTQERHYIWLTALSFLAHSSSPIPDLNAMPAVAPPVEELPPRNSGATLRRTHVRDSVRLAKGKANPVMQRQRAAAADANQDWYNSYDKPVADAADPPVIPRGPYHGRKRSSTGPRMPPPGMGFRSFSHQHVPSVYSTGSSDVYMQPPSVPSSIYNPNSVITSTRTSEASTSTRHNFFDSMGTVRMEAFIEDGLQNGNGVSYAARARMGRRRGNSQWSNSTNDRVGGPYDDFLQEANDPFRGF